MILLTLLFLQSSKLFADVYYESEGVKHNTSKFDTVLSSAKKIFFKIEFIQSQLDSGDFLNLPIVQRIDLIDRFLNFSKLPNNDSLSLNYKLQKAELLTDIGYFDKALNVLDTIKNYTSKEYFPIIYFNSLAIIATAQKRLNNQESEGFLVKFLEEAKSVNSLDGEYLAHIHLGDYFRKIGQPDKTVPHYYRADEIAELQNDFAKLDRTKAKLGKIAKAAGELAIALNYFKKSLEYAKFTENPKRILDMEFTILQNSAKISRVDKIKKALLYIQKLDYLGYKKDLANYYDWIAKLSYRIKDFDKSREYSKKAIEYGKVGKLQSALIYSYNRLGILEYDSGNYQNALSYLFQAEKYFLPEEKPGYGIYIYECISDCYAALGKHQIATEAMRKAKHFQMLENKISIRTTLITRFAKYAFKKERETELEIQKIKNDKQKRKNDLRRIENEQIMDERKYIILSLLGILFTISIALFFTFKISKERKKSLSIQNEKNKLIEEQRNELHKLNKMKDKFFSVIAHDLRGPIGNMTRLSKLILMTSQHNEDEENTRIASLLSSSSKSVQLLLQSLLLWGKVQMKVTEPNKSEFYLKSRVTEILKVYQDGISSKKITLKMSIDESHILFVDEGMIDAVLRNLIHNAVKFSNENGTIELKSYIVDEAICINVIDEGIGLDKEKINEVLSESTIQQSSNRKSGLGLILAKEFIALNGGKMAIESELGKGTNVKFTLPMFKNQV
jgi:signal transduction histidine kinase